MKSILMTSAVLVSSTFALADNLVSRAEAQKIKAALKAWGCSGGKMERDTEHLSYKVGDAKCKDGLFDIKLDNDFRVLEITRDDPE
jgi:hypothetical protein